LKNQEALLRCYLLGEIEERIVDAVEQRPDQQREALLGDAAGVLDEVAHAIRLLRLGGLALLQVDDLVVAVHEHPLGLIASRATA